jgi:hypothetical protein
MIITFPSFLYLPPYDQFILWVLKNGNGWGLPVWRGGTRTLLLWFSCEIHSSYIYMPPPNLCLNCHRVMVRNAAGTTRKMIYARYLCTHWMCRCKSRCAHLLSPCPRALRRLITRGIQCVSLSAGRPDFALEICLARWFGALVFQVSAADWAYAFTLALICLLDILHFSLWPWVGLCQLNHLVEKWLRLPRVIEHNFI